MRGFLVAIVLYMALMAVVNLALGVGKYRAKDPKCVFDVVLAIFQLSFAVMAACLATRPC